MVAGKLQNTRNILMRAAREAQEEGDRNALKAAAKIHADSIQSAEKASDLDKLRGTEGYAAKSYFAAFSSMVRTNRTVFEFVERSRRPPRDPINALLSFVYTLLVNECVSACEGVGPRSADGLFAYVTAWRTCFGARFDKGITGAFSGSLGFDAH